MRTHVYVCMAEEDASLAVLLLERLRGPFTGLVVHDPGPKGRFHDPAAGNVRERLEAQIRASDVVACLIGPAGHRSPWLAWELETGEAAGCGIVAVRLRIGAHDFLPRALHVVGAQVVDSDPGCVTACIERAAFTARVASGNK